MKKTSAYVSRDRVVAIYPLLDQLYEEIIGLVLDHHGRLSFHDALIVLAARELGVGHIVSFDEDFDEVEWVVRIKEEDDLDTLKL